MPVTLKNILFLLIVLIAIIWLHESLFQNVFAASPSFPRQEITNPLGHWSFMKEPFNETTLRTHNGTQLRIETAKNILECKMDNGSFPFPDIKSVTFISDGKTLNSTVWLTSPIREPPLNDTRNKERSYITTIF